MILKWIKIKDVNSFTYLKMLKISFLSISKTVEMWIMKNPEAGNLHAGTDGRGATHAHGEGTLAAWLAAAVLQQLQVHLADVVLQVERGGELGRAGESGAVQGSSLRGMAAFVAAQRLPSIKGLPALLAGVCH